MRKSQEARGGATGYDRRCRRLAPEERARQEAEGAPSVVRLAMPESGTITLQDLVYGEITVDCRTLDDPVLLKANGWPTYHLAAATDDHDTAITHVLRGEEWLPSAPKHVHLFRSMGWPEPFWVHLPLLLGPDRKKLSKRHGSTQFVDFIREGYLPEALFNFLALLGWSPGEAEREIFTRQEILERFSIAGLMNHPAVFDFDKLRWMNGEHLRRADPERILRLSLPFLSRAGIVGDPPSEDERAYAAKVIPLVIERMKVLSEAAPLTAFFFQDPAEPEEKGRRKWLAGPQAEEILRQAEAWFSRLEPEFTDAAAELMVDAVSQALGVPRATVIHTLRVAVTGRTAGPGLFETLAVLGRDRVVRRLRSARGWILPEAQPG